MKNTVTYTVSQFWPKFWLSVLVLLGITSALAILGGGGFLAYLVANNENPTDVARLWLVMGFGAAIAAWFILAAASWLWVDWLFKPGKRTATLVQIQPDDSDLYIDSGERL